jgi:hypothetical protein
LVHRNDDHQHVAEIFDGSPILHKNTQENVDIDFLLENHFATILANLVYELFDSFLIRVFVLIVDNIVANIFGDELSLQRNIVKHLKQLFVPPDFDTANKLTVEAETFIHTFNLRLIHVDSH